MRDQEQAGGAIRGVSGPVWDEMCLAWKTDESGGARGAHKKFPEAFRQSVMTVYSLTTFQMNVPLNQHHVSCQ